MSPDRLPSHPVVIPGAVFERIVDALRFAANADTAHTLAKASERARLLLIDLLAGEGVTELAGGHPPSDAPSDAGPAAWGPEWEAVHTSVAEVCNALGVMARSSPDHARLADITEAMLERLDTIRDECTFSAGLARRLLDRGDCAGAARSVDRVLSLTGERYARHRLMLRVPAAVVAARLAGSAR